MRAFCLALLIGGCTATSAPGGAASNAPLVFAVPATLRTEFDTIAASYRAHHPEVSLSVITATPTQISDENLPVDVVAAESADAMQVLVPRLNPADRREYAANPLSLVTRAGAAELRLRSMASAPWVKKVAIADGRGDPTGAAAEAAMGRLGNRRELADRLVYTGNETLALEKLAHGEVDVAFALATDVAQWNAHEGNAKLQVADRLGEDPRAHLPIGVVAGTQHLAAARALVDEVMRTDGQKLFAQRGLLAPSTLLQR